MSDSPDSTDVDRPIKTINDFLIGGNSFYLQPVVPVRVTTRQQGFRTAAWLLCLADVLPEEDPPSSFEDVLAAIRNT